MSVLGTGIVPSGTLGSELTYVTRRAFVPRMIVQIYNSSPTMASLIANSQTATGGVSSVSVPVQGTAFVNSGWSDYSGTFPQPSPQQGAYLAEHNLKLLITPIPFLGMEGVVQLDHSVIPLIEARMNDSTNSAVDTMSTAIYGNYSNNQQFIGFPGAIDDGTNLVTYGNINRTSNTWWKANVTNKGGATAPTRALILQDISKIVKACGEKPNFAVTGMGTWQSLANDYIGVEQFRVTPGTGFDLHEDGARSAFMAVSVGGVPVYSDPYATEGTFYYVNTDYTNLYIHQSASFAFTGFESLLANFQLGYVGAVVSIAELVVTKPKANGRVYGYTSITL